MLGSGLDVGGAQVGHQFELVVDRSGDRRAGGDTDDGVPTVQVGGHLVTDHEQASRRLAGSWRMKRCGSGGKMVRTWMVLPMVARIIPNISRRCIARVKPSEAARRSFAPDPSLRPV